MTDLDYSPALNEDGTEFDIVKAAEIAKAYEAWNVLLRVMQDEGIVGRKRQRIEDAARGYAGAMSKPKDRQTTPNFGAADAAATRPAEDAGERP